MSEIEIKVPNIGDFKDVEIIEILVNEGQSIEKNDPIITLESDKSSVEVPSTNEGVIEELKVKVGDKVSKGDLILTLASSSNSQSENKKIEIPPVTEQIILEAEQNLKKEETQERAQEET